MFPRADSARRGGRSLEVPWLPPTPRPAQGTLEALACCPASQAEGWLVLRPAAVTSRMWPWREAAG